MIINTLDSSGRPAAQMEAAPARGPRAASHCGCWLLAAGCERRTASCELRAASAHTFPAGPLSSGPELPQTNARALMASGRPPLLGARASIGALGRPPASVWRLKSGSGREDCLRSVEAR